MTWREGTGESWMLAWLDEQEARSSRDVAKLLRRRSSRNQLRDRLEEVPYGPPQIIDPLEPRLAAGSGIDLSANLGCFACLQTEFDTLFQRVGHYFDKLLVVGPSAHYLAGVFKTDSDHALMATQNLAEFMLHVREIGAEPYLIFGEKPPICLEHLGDHAREAGMSEVLQGEDIWAADLFEGATIEVSLNNGHWHGALNHPVLEHTVWQVVQSPVNSTEATVKHEILVQTFRRYVAHLIADVRFARMCEAPLGAGVAVHERVLSEQLREPVSELHVAMELSFPFINGLTARELIAIREHEGASFEKFRNALKLAITERVKGAADGVDSVGIAAEVIEDVIQPALIEIETKLDAARRMLMRGSTVALGSGSVATTVGLLASVPLVVGPIVSAIFAAPDYRAYLNQKREIELSDMYFLWQLSSPGHGRRHLRQPRSRPGNAQTSKESNLQNALAGRADLRDWGSVPSRQPPGGLPHGRS